MARSRSFYNILGVTKDATADEIKRAYRKLARKLHPDVNKAGDAAEKFKEVQEAYETLSDEKKRKMYDRVGHAAFVRGATGAAADSGRGGRGPTYTWSNIGSSGAGDASSSFDFGDISDVFAEMFGGGGGRRGSAPRDARTRSRPKAGRDIHKDRLISFETAIAGGRESIRVGRGGAVQTLDVKIPKGVDEGAKLRIAGGGEPSPTGAKAGDLILTIHVGKHSLFVRQGLDVTLELPLTIVEATIGATVEIPTPAGERVKLKIPAGSASGSRLRLKGRGVVTDDGRKGDLFAVLKIVPPKELSKNDRAMLESLGERLASPRTGAIWG